MKLFKKSQLTIFAILGLVLIIVIAFFAFKSNSNGTELLKSQNNVVSFSSTSESLKGYINECLKQTSEEALAQYGLTDSYSKIEGYIQDNIEKCIDFSLYEKQGFEIVKSSPVVYITLLDETILITLKYPIDLKKDSSFSHIEEFKRDFQRTTYTKTDDVKNKDIYLSTENNAAHLKIPQGTKITMPDGKTIDKVSLKVIDNNFDGLANSAVVGSMAFEGKPDGAQFDPPIDLTLRFRKEDIPVGVDPKSLAVAWYDAENDMWRSVPSEVDLTSMTVKGEIKHFSNYAVVFNCNPKMGPRSEFDLKTLYTQQWRPSKPEDCDRETSFNLNYFSIIRKEGIFTSPVEFTKIESNRFTGEEYKGKEFYQNGELLKKNIPVRFASASPPLPQWKTEILYDKTEDIKLQNYYAQPIWYYKSVNDIGGTGILKFYITNTNGASCFPENYQLQTKIVTDINNIPETAKGSQGDIILVIQCSKDDNCNLNIENYFKSKSGERNSLSAKEENGLYVHVENKKGICAEAKGRLILNTGTITKEFIDETTMCSICGGDKETKCESYCPGIEGSGCKKGNSLCTGDKKCYQKASDCKVKEINLGNCNGGCDNLKCGDLSPGPDSPPSCYICMEYMLAYPESNAVSGLPGWVSILNVKDLKAEDIPLEKCKGNIKDLKPICDPVTQPTANLHYGISPKDGKCYPSCGQIGTLGKFTTKYFETPCFGNYIDAGIAWDIGNNYCCKPKTN
jgi:hypothetical protein